METCSCCEEEFEHGGDNYKWTCRTDDHECSHWCGREEQCPAMMHVCDGCDYGVCEDCVQIVADNEHQCPMCVEDIAAEGLPVMIKNRKAT